MLAFALLGALRLFFWGGLTILWAGPESLPHFVSKLFSKWVILYVTFHKCRILGLGISADASGPSLLMKRWLVGNHWGNSVSQRAIMTCWYFFVGCGFNARIRSILFLDDRTTPRACRDHPVSDPRHWHLAAAGVPDADEVPARQGRAQPVSGAMSTLYSTGKSSFPGLRIGDFKETLAELGKYE